MGLAPDSELKLSSELTPMPDTGFVGAIDRLLAQARSHHPELIAAGGAYARLWDSWHGASDQSLPDGHAA